MNGLEDTFTTWGAGGWLLIPLAIVSVVIMALIFRSSFSLRSLTLNLDPLCSALESKQFTGQEALQLLEAQGTWIGNAYLKALKAIQTGEPGIRTLEGIETQCVEAQRKDELLLSAFTASAPLLGLLGTVMGMIDTFDAVASVSGDTGTQVADGISSALITTQFGLVIALPGVFGIAHMHKKIRNLETRFAQCRFLLLEALQPFEKESNNVS